MAKQLVDTTTNNGTHIGDPAKTAFEKVNANFNELYPAALPATEPERAAARARFGLGTAATRNTGQSGAAVPLLNQVNTWSSRQIIAGLAAQATPLFIERDGNMNVSVAFRLGSTGEPTHIGMGPNTPGELYIGTDADLQGKGNRIFHSGNASALPITGSLSPATDNSVSYGTAARRPTQLFAATATIGTSDAREKTPVRELT